MNKTESIKNISKAIMTFHKEMEVVKKTSANPFFKSKYASLPDVLSAIKEPLEKSGLSFMQFPKGVNELETIIMHSESGEYMSESFYMKPTQETPQASGSVITYQRRYALGSILGLNIAEDDDAAIASIPAKITEKPELKPGTELWNSAIDYIKAGKDFDNIKGKYTLSATNEKKLIEQTK